MRRLWFQFSQVSITVCPLVLLLACPAKTAVSAQAIVTGTDTPGGPTPFITVTYIEPVNVRSGPSTVFYPIIGQLPVGSTATALGVSPSRDWYETSLQAGAKSIG